MPRELLPDSILKARKAAIKKNGVKSVLSMAELNARWKKKKEHLEKIASNIRSLRYNLTRDLKSDDEKTRLTALVISVMDCSAERVGNEDSESNGHFGVTGFQKKHVKVDGNTITLKYKGKSGVEHEKSFSDPLIARVMKQAIKDSPNKFVFCTSDGFRIRADKVNRYLNNYHITAKDIRGYCANTYILNRLKNYEIIKANADLPEEKAQKKRKAVFNKAVKYAAEKVGHGPATLKNHYLMPEVSRDYIQYGRIINLSDFYSKGGEVKGKEELNKPKISVKGKKPCGCKHKLSKPLITKLENGGATKRVPRDLDTDLGVQFGQKIKGTGEIIVAHSTSSNLLPKIYKEGLVSGKKSVWEEGETTKGNLYFEIDPTYTHYGENVYGWKAVQTYGGVPVTLYVKVKQKDLQIDQDDAGLGSRYQKNQRQCSCDIPPENIIGLKFVGIDIARKDFIEFSKMFSDDKFLKGGLIAPNGKPSNLTPQQYQLVRTPAFKKWFGDWENDPKNSSKVIDENGEPLIVYHGSYFNFNVFDRDKLSVTLSPDKKELFNTGGFYFSNDKEISLSYKNRRPNKYQDKARWLKSYLHKHKVRSFFLRLMNPLIVQGEGKVWNNLETINGLPHSTNDISYRTYKEGKHDGVIFYNIHDTADDDYVLRLSNSFVAFDSSQIKLADGSNTTFDLKSPDVRYKKGGEVKKSEIEKQIDAYIKEGIFIGKGDKVYTGMVNISRFKGPDADIFPGQSTVGKSGVRSWRKRIQAGERPAVLVDFKPINDRFQMTDGHTRLVAYDQLGFTEIPVIDKSGKLVMDNKEKISLQEGGKLNEGKIKILYLHGIGATPESDHITILANDNVEIIAPYLDYDRKDLFKMLCHIIERIHPDGIVGHSAGGFLAFYLSNKFRIPSLMFNPAFNCEVKSMHMVPEKAMEIPFFNKQVAVVGSEDKEVVMVDQLAALESVGVIVFIEKIGHDIPDEIKLKYFNHFMEWFKDFDKSEKGSNFTVNTTKDEIKHVISGTREVTNGAAIQAAARYLKGVKEPSSVVKDPKYFKAQEARSLKDYALSKNLWISEIDSKNYASQGAEQDVYFLDPKTVIKTNYAIYYNSWLDYLNSLLIHNYFFPATAYELVGFTENNGYLLSVVKQPLIKATEKTDLDIVKQFLEANGFVNTKNNDYKNPELGLILEDLHDENVLTRDGVLYFVDTVFYIFPEKYNEGGLIAPNGKPSNLTPAQYKLVRSPEFKEWFGDWENDPDNSSKVIDENGEPLVVYHGSRAHDITEFREDKMRPEDYDAPFNGFWFSDDPQTSPAMIDPLKTYAVFLNLRNDAPYFIYKKVRKEIEKQENEGLGNSRGYGDATRLKLKELGYDGVIWEFPPDIDQNKFEQEGKYEFKTVRGKKYWIEKDEEHGGVDLYDNFVGHVTGYYDVQDLVDSFEKIFVVFSPNQIKLADGTNTTFDPKNPDIRFEHGGNILSASSRFRPYETIVFDPPIIGPSGAQLISYIWAYEWQEDFNEKIGETVSKRVSDWSQAEQSADTGKNIVHQFNVKFPNGKVETVSSESVLILLGYTNRTAIKSFPSLVNAIKTLAKQRMQLAIFQAQEKEYKELREKFEKETKPEITEKKELDNFSKRILEETPDQFTIYQMGDVFYRQDNPFDYDTRTHKKIGHPTNHTIEQLTLQWISKRVEENGGKFPREIRDLEKRIERQERKVKLISKATSEEAEKFMNGGKVDTSRVKKKLSMIYKRLKSELSRRI